ncbi:MAG: SUMF1/EgtB/PvdO family nonheme iron enzyme [Planctomycetes bacterium]|nr:SUMF1/EgtB/PvdO family nonheme iron enzyme [Planctomycetota bacterium]
MNLPRPFVLPAALLALAACKAPDGVLRPGSDAPSAKAVEVAAAALGAPFEEVIPTCATTLKLVPIPGEKPLWMGATEVPWEVYDVYLFKQDLLRGLTNEKVDAVTRSTQPYVPMDQGFGHAGYPALSMACLSAQNFCAWLSAHTGRTYRLPTEAEWERAARAGEQGDWLGGAALDEYAWTKSNASDKTQPIGKRKPNAFGLHDVIGNTGEWCLAPDGSGVVRGGSYRSTRDEARYSARLLPVPEWNRRDPQIPQSKFWLTDAPFVGFRVVCEGPAPAAR